METHKVRVCLISADKTGKFRYKTVAAYLFFQKPRDLLRTVRESPIQCRYARQIASLHCFFTQVLPQIPKLGRQFLIFICPRGI